MLTDVIICQSRLLMQNILYELIYKSMKNIIYKLKLTN